jgi:vacuolar protein sorting-associated protein 33A
MQLQSTFGLFPRLTGKGDKAKILADMLLRMRQESIIDSRTVLYGVGQSQSIESLIIIDREVDFITPLLTQLTYEGLIDEKFGIKNSTLISLLWLTIIALVELDTSLVAPSNADPSASSSGTQQNLPSRTRKQPLNSSDPLYASLRDINFAIVATMLNRVARRLSDDYEVPSTSCSLLTLGTTSSQDRVPDKRIREQIDGITSRASITATPFLLCFSLSNPRYQSSRGYHDVYIETEF